MLGNRTKYLYIIAAFFLVVYILPNMLNYRERHFFSEAKRLDKARMLSGKNKDSVTLIPGEYYRRNKTYTYFFGENNRPLWTTPVRFRIFDYGTAQHGWTPYEVGGSMQTISIRLRDSTGKNWVMRSVNKDQQNVLPWWLRYSILRSLFRDQVAAMNPYAPKVVAELSEALALPHLHPQMFWIPYAQNHGRYNDRMAGRLVYLEEYIDSTWQHHPSFENALRIMETKEMERVTEKEHIAIDTFMYLKTRLLDMLVNDWDRHQDQWRWALTVSEGRKMLKPIARDRDMAFYVFDEGIINKMAVRANNKFQSYRKQFGEVEGLMKQSKQLDRKILKGLPQPYFIATAKELQAQLSPAIITRAFSQYPPVVYRKYGKQHEQILTERLGQLTAVAETFYKVVNDDQ